MTMENLCHDALGPLQQASLLPGISESQHEQLQLVLADCQLRTGRPRQADKTLNGTFSDIPNGKFLVPMIRSRVLLETRKYDLAFEELAAIRDEAMADPTIRPEFLLLTAAEQGDLGQFAAARATLYTLAQAFAADPNENVTHAIVALRLLAGLGDATDTILSVRLKDLALNRPRATPIHVR
jgi:hypothetical protein